MSSKYSMSGPDGELASRSSTGSGDAGCYVSLVHGFILVLLAVVIAVGVGVVVFLAGGREVMCQCGQVGGSEPNDGTTSGPPTMSPEAIRQMCIDVITAGDGEEICQACTGTTDAPSTSDAPTTSAPTEAPRDYRLPITVRPYLYTLELQPNLYGSEDETFDFVGSVKIAVVAEKVSKTIVLHAHPTLNITKDSIKITDVNNTENVALHGTSYEALREFFTLHLSSDLTVGHHYAIEMSFRGPLTQSNSGLYLAQYEEDGKKIYLATTQFEAPHARRAFPCFDEPAMKAQFDITLVRQESGERKYRSLSNTPQERQEPAGNGMVKDIYKRTVVMPTYLLAFIVCDYEYVEDSVSNVMYRTWSMPKRLQFTETAQRHGLKLFEKYASYFKPEYVYTKLDNIAIPDFRAGAMENWGLITYRDTLLYEPGVSAASNEDWIAEVISHEVAHQWFGNLVSPRWWNWLWLNEAFASFWDYHIVGEIYPHWRKWFGNLVSPRWWNWLWLNEAFASFWDYHIVGEIYPHWRKLDIHVVVSGHSALSSDGLRTSHPLTADVMTTSEISSIFDAITYSKGAAVVRMMHLAMGQELFIKALNRYLDAHKYGTAVHQDLWDALNEEAESNNVNLNMTEIMDPWVTQMNYPVVDVTINRDKGQITLTQKRFLVSGSANASQDVGTYGYKWTVPITYTTSGSPNFTTEYINAHVHYMKYHEDSLALNVTVPTNGWVIVNLQQCGFFRVNYDVQNWENILNFLSKEDHKAIHPINRAQIINDAWNLAKADLLPQEIALKTANHLSKDLDYAPWRAFIRELEYVEQMLERTTLFGMFEEFIRKSVDTPYTTLGSNMTEDMPPVDKIEKAQIVRLACKYDYPSCVDAALQEFGKWQSNPSNNSIYPDLRLSYYCTAVRHGGLSEWTFVYDQYHLAVDSSERNRLRESLACTREPWLLQRVLDMSVDANEIRSQDARTSIAHVANSRWGRELAWNFVTHNYNLLFKILETASGMSSLFRDTTSKFNTEQEYNMVVEFMKREDVAAIGSALNQVLEKTRSNTQWLEANYKVFDEWLQAETVLPKQR